MEHLRADQNSEKIKKCCQLRQDLIHEITDEANATVKYRNIGKKLEELNLPFNEILQKVALDEYLHKLILEGMVYELNNYCHCEDK